MENTNETTSATAGNVSINTTQNAPVGILSNTVENSPPPATQTQAIQNIELPKLPDNWYKAIDPNDKSLSKFTDISALAKSYKHLESLMGAKSNAVIIPGKDATPEAKAAYYKAIGVPDSPDKYEYKDMLDDSKLLPDAKANVDAFKLVAKEIGLNNDQLKAILKYDIDRGAKYEELTAKAKTDQIETTKAELQKEYGKSFNDNIAKASQIAKQFGGEQVLKSDLANNPDFIKMCVNIANNLKEETVSPQGINTTINPLVNIEAEINKHMGDAKGAYWDSSNPMHMNARQTVQQLLQQKINLKRK